MTKFLVLRIYNKSEEYDLMRKLHFENDESIFVVYNPNLSEAYNYDKKERLLEIKGSESYIPGILDKSIVAIKLCNELFDFDFIIRSNISTVIDLKLLENKLPITSDYSGHVHVICWINHRDGLCDNSLFGVPYVSGTSIILSKKIIPFLVRSNLDRSLIDDVSIGKLMYQNHIYPYNICYTEDIINNIGKCCFFRHCSMNRLKDVETMKLTYEKIHANNSL